MIAKISTGKSIIGLINYNENKVAKGDARLLTAQNMVLGKRESELSYDMKVGTFERIIDGKKSKKLEKTTFHVSLNFDPTEKPTDDLLREIASKYMEGIGYGNQPFLVYRHEDTHHPHIHIVSIKVDREGKKVKDTFYKRQSEKVRKDLEIEYNLVKASEKVKQAMNQIHPLSVTGLEYTKEETKKAITNIVGNLLTNYKITSLHEFNILLKQYNIKGEHIKGISDAKSYEGLVYSLTDNKGNRVGVGIKASSIYGKPTLQNLEVQFEKNIELKKKLGKVTANEIEKLFSAYSSITREDFTKQLAERGISAQYHEGKNGIYGITFIDHIQKALFKGRELGKHYSCKALEKRFDSSTISIKTVKHGYEIDSAYIDLSNHNQIEKELLKQASSALTSIYSQQQRANDSGEYFESMFIKKLHQIDLANPLLKQLPSLTHKQASELEVKFKEYKRGKLKDIENKEKDSFKKHVQKAFNLIDHVSHLSPQEKLAFLYRYQIDISREDNTYVAKHIKGEHLKLGIESHTLKKLLHEKEPLPAIDRKNLVPFTKNQRGVIEKVLETRSDLQDSHNQHKFIREIFKNPLANEANRVTSNVTLADVFQLNENEKGVESNSTKNKKRIKFKIS